MHAGPYKSVGRRQRQVYPMRLIGAPVARQPRCRRPTGSATRRTGPRTTTTSTSASPYPFKKYDQILRAATSIYGAMENAGAVTFTENRFTFGHAR